MPNPSNRTNTGKMKGSARLVVYVLLALLIVGIPLEFKACAEDCEWCSASNNAAIGSSSSENSQSDDSTCCASCVCCHGYAADSSGASPTPVDFISALSVEAQIDVLDGSRSTLVIAVLASLMVSLVQISAIREDIRDMRGDLKLLTGNVYEIMGEKH